MARPRSVFAFRAAAAAAVALALLPAAASAQMAVQVIGLGFARDCYDAVKGRLVKAAKALEICTTALDEQVLSDRNRAATLINRGIIHMRAERHELALADYAQALELAPNMAEVQINLGAVDYYLGRYREAVEALDKGIGVEDREARAAAYYNRGLAHERLGDIDAAFADYNAALSAKPGFEPAAHQLARFKVVADKDT